MVQVEVDSDITQIPPRKMYANQVSLMCVNNMLQDTAPVIATLDRLMLDINGLVIFSFQKYFCFFSPLCMLLKPTKLEI